MSDEEKKAIKELTEIKELVEEDLKYANYGVTATLDQIDLESLVIVLNLIEKQQKEIEELNKENTRQHELICNIHKKWKDKIKTKIEEVDIEIQQCEYADDDIEEYKQDMEKEKRRLLRDKVVLQSLLVKQEEN